MTNFFDHAFDGATRQFTSPAIIPNCSHPYDIDLAYDCLRSLAREPSEKLHRDCRVYVNGRQLGPFEAKLAIKRVVVAGIENIKNWSSAFGNDEFLIFLNRAAQFSTRLRDATFSYLGSFPERFQSPGIEIEHHVIIGRYSETAFGVHVDDPQDRVMHFNVGPSQKEMLLWPRDEYMQRFGDGARPLSQVPLENSTCYEMDPGTCFFLPADFFHVGRSHKGVSCVIALAFSRMTHEMVLRETIEEVRYCLGTKEDNSIYWNNFLHIADDEIFQRWTYHLNDRGLDWFRKTAEMRRRSNACFAEVGELRLPTIPKHEFSIALRNQMLLVKDDNPTGLRIFAGGHCMQFNSSEVRDCFVRLAKGESYDLSGREFVMNLRKRDSIALALAWALSTGIFAISYSNEMA